MIEPMPLEGYVSICESSLDIERQNRDLGEERPGVTGRL
jgi:hypothetical protein